MIWILQLDPYACTVPHGLPIMPTQSCISIPAVPEGWHKPEQYKTSMT